MWSKQKSPWSYQRQTYHPWHSSPKSFPRTQTKAYQKRKRKRSPWPWKSRWKNNSFGGTFWQPAAKPRREWNQRQIPTRKISWRRASQKNMAESSQVVAALDKEEKRTVLKTVESESQGSWGSGDDDFSSWLWSTVNWHHWHPCVSGSFYVRYPHSIIRPNRCTQSNRKPGFC